jgi:hypothetical protein
MSIHPAPSTNFQRIVVMADLLRPFPQGTQWESATWKNTRWLRHILHPTLRSLGHAPTTLAWDPRSTGLRDRFFDAPALYHQLGYSITLESWARLACTPQPPQALLQALDEALGDAFVIGYELPPAMLNALDQLGRPYVDVVLHPWRFLPDLVFALRSNVPAWHARIVAQRLPRSAAEQQVALIQAKAAWMPAPMELPPGTALVLGQVYGDRATALPNGQFATLAEHLPRLQKLCREHPLVLYRSHPYAGPQDPSTLAIRQLSAIKMVDHNFYHLLAQPELDSVVALNSSGLNEAEIFERGAINLIPFLYDFDGNGSASPVALDSRWTQLGFWQALIGPPDHAGDMSTRLADQALRRTMHADWGYGFIDKVCA